MNRTFQLAIAGFGPPEEEREDAKKYFAEKYPDAVYIEETDSVVYRGETLDYFKSGYCPDRTQHEFDSYMLVDPSNPRNWLFTYGDDDEMWRDFLKRRTIQKEVYMPRKRSILEFLFGK